MPSRPQNPSHGWSRILAIAGLVAVVVMAVLGAVEAARGKAGDFLCFYDAALAARQGLDIYEAGARGYIYPPLLAWLLQPLSVLPAGVAGVVWVLAMACLTLFASGLAAREFAGWFRLPATPVSLQAAAGFGVLIVFDKLLRELKEGNCNLLLILAVVLSLRWLTRRPWLAGVALGLAINIKYLPVVFVPYLLVRGRFKALGGLVLGVAAFALLPALTFGWRTNLEYLQTAFGGLVHMDGGRQGAAINPLAWPASVSIPSALARWQERTGIHGLVLAGTIAAASMGLAIAWSICLARRVPLLLGRWGLREDAPDRAGVVGLEWAMLSAGVLAFSPQTPARHMNLALPLCVLAGLLVLHGTAPVRRVSLVGAAIFLAAMLLPPGTKSLAWMVQGWRDLAGMSLGLLALLFCVQWSGLSAAREQTVTGRS